MEEAALSGRDLRDGLRLARAGAVGAISLGPGSVLAAVGERPESLGQAASVEVPILDEVARAALIEVVAAESDRLDALRAGDLPHPLVEEAEETGVELLPFGSEFATACTCGAPDPCRHALALLTQVGWLQDADPLVLLALRGLAYPALQQGVRALRPPEPAAPVSAAPVSAAPVSADGDFASDDLGLETALEAALEAALRARLLLEESPAGQD